MDKNIEVIYKLVEETKSNNRFILKYLFIVIFVLLFIICSITILPYFTENYKIQQDINSSEITSSTISNGK